MTGAISIPARTDLPVRGIVMMLGFAALGPVIDTFAKLAADAVPVGQIAAARFVVQAVLMLGFGWAMGILHWPDRNETLLHLARGALVLLATGFFFYALKFMPIADAIAIFFVEPLILTLLGAVVLRETVGWRRITACVIGFGGALLVIQPSFERLGWVAALPLGTAATFAVYLLLTRQMSHKVHPVTLQAYNAVAATIIIVPLLWLFSGTGNEVLSPVWPDATNWLWLLGVGLAATAAHLFISYAFKYASVSVLAPLQYLEIISATLLGWLVFSDLPNALSVLGVTIIVGSGLYVFWRERNLSQSAPPTPQAVPHAAGSPKAPPRP